MLGLLCAELCRSALSSVATSRNLTNQDTRELVLELDCDVHSLEDENISAVSDNDTDHDTDDILDTKLTHRTDSTNCQPAVPIVHRFTVGASGL